MALQQYKFNSSGRRYVQGKAAGSDLIQLIVLNLLENRADPLSGVIPRGVQENTARVFKMSRNLVRTLWSRYW